MPFSLTPSQDPVTGQFIFTVPEGTPAALKKKISDDDYVWGSTSKKKRNGKRKTQYLVDNDFAYIESISDSDILSLPGNPDAYDILPAPYIDGHAVVVDQRSRTNVIALINDPTGFFA